MRSTGTNRRNTGLLWFFCIAAMASLVAAGTPGSPGDTTADVVFGQFDFNHGAANFVDGKGFFNPALIATGSSSLGGSLYLADSANNRVLGWCNSAKLTNTQVADLVIGQSDFISYSAPTTPTPQTLKGAQGVATDTLGNLYVADTGANRVLVFANPCAAFASSNQETGFSPELVFGQSDDFNTSACTTPANSTGPTANSLCIPEGIAVDASGNLFVADVGTNRVLEYFNPLIGGGTGVPGSAGDTTADVVFGQNGDFTTSICNIGGERRPDRSLCLGGIATSNDGLTVDSNDNLFVTDTGNLRVLEYSGPFGLGKLNNTIANLVFSGATGYTGLATDTADNLYVAQTNTIVEYNNPGVTSDTAPVLTIGPSLNPQGIVGATPLGNISGLAMDSTFRLYAVDAANNRVVAFGETSTPSNGSKPNLVLGQQDYVEGQANLEDSLGVSGPGAVAVDTSSTPNNIYVVDSVNNRVLGWDDVDDLINLQPADIVIGQPNFFTSYCYRTGSKPPSANGLCFTNGKKSTPGGLAVDSLGNLFVADTQNSRVLEFPAPFQSGISSGESAGQVFGQGGKFSTSSCNLGGTSPTAFSLCTPLGIFVDSVGNLWISDTGNNRVLVYPSANPIASPVLVFGQQGSFTSSVQSDGIGSDPPTSATGLAVPVAVAVDQAGNAYISDSNNNRVLEFDEAIAANNTSPHLVFGQDNFVSNGCNDGVVSLNGLVEDPDSLCLASSMSTENGLAVDQAGDLLVADSDNNRVLLFVTPTNPNSGAPGAGDTLADEVFGFNTFGTKPSGLPISADTLSNPRGVALDAGRDLFVSDTGNNRVLMYLKPISALSPSPTLTPRSTPSATPTPIPSVELRISPKLLNFGTITVGTTSKPKFVTITNGSHSTPAFGVIFGTPSSTNSLFGVVSECEQPLLPSESCQIKVTFTPTEPTHASAILKITDNLPQSSLTTSVTGRGKNSKHASPLSK